MLVAFKEELKKLAVEDSDRFHAKVKQRIGKRATQILEQRLKQIILIMPSLIRRIQHYWQLKRSDYRVKKLGSFVLAYMYQPKDLLAMDVHGLFGYLDDAYLVVDVYERMLKEVSAPNKEDHEYMAIIAKTKKYVKVVIPDVTRKIEKMVDEALEKENFEMFASAFQGEV